MFLWHKTGPNNLLLNEEKVKKYKKLSDYSSDLTFKSLPYEIDLIAKDSSLGEKRKRWHKNLSKDIVKDILPIIIKKKHLYAYKTIEYLNDFGTPDRFRDVKHCIKKGNIKNLALKNKKTAVFLDRDGVINKELGVGVKNINDFHILPKVGKAIAKLNINNIPCFIVSNQSVLAKKQITLDHFKKIIMFFDMYLSKHKAYVDDFLFCPNYKNIKYKDKKNSFFSKFRKPNPGMIFSLTKKYNINL